MPVTNRICFYGAWRTLAALLLLAAVTALPTPASAGMANQYVAKFALVNDYDAVLDALQFDILGVRPGAISKLELMKGSRFQGTRLPLEDFVNRTRVKIKGEVRAVKKGEAPSWRSVSRPA